jgi:hypothetical protein
LRYRVPKAYVGVSVCGTECLKHMSGFPFAVQSAESIRRGFRLRYRIPKAYVGVSVCDTECLKHTFGKVRTEKCGERNVTPDRFIVIVKQIGPQSILFLLSEQILELL